jgi:hypothetical protein
MAKKDTSKTPGTFGTEHDAGHAAGQKQHGRAADHGKESHPPEREKEHGREPLSAPHETARPAEVQKMSSEIAATKAATAEVRSLSAPHQPPQPTAPGHPQPAGQTGPVRKWRVTLDGVRVRVVDPVKEAGFYQDYLDVDASSAWEACEAFARYNGIPVGQDPETGERRLLSTSRPRAVPIEGDAPPPAQAPPPQPLLPLEPGSGPPPAVLQHPPTIQAVPAAAAPPPLVRDPQRELHPGSPSVAQPSQPNPPPPEA